MHQPVEDIQNLFAAGDQLPQALQVISQADARSLAGGTLVHPLDHSDTLVEQDEQVLVIAGERLGITPGQRIRLDIH